MKVELDDHLIDRARSVARRRRVSVGALVRKAIEREISLDEGRRRRARAGGTGRTRFGYRRVHGGLVPDPDEQRVVARIRRLRGQGLSWRAICDALDVAGLEPRGRSSTWHPNTVRRIHDYRNRPR